MSVLSGDLIRQHGIILPHHPRTEINVGGDTFSYGQSFAGYDVRVEFDADGGLGAKYLVPGEFLLASTVEKFHMPDDVIGFVHDKSSWARKGLAVQNTVIEPGWRGHLTLELTNHSKGWIYLKKGHPIAQIVFMYVAIQPGTSPKGYDGKYQDQERGPQNAR